MNKNYTLKELADIGAKAANSCLPDGVRMCVLNGAPPHHVVARQAFTKAILDAIGYEFPKDKEREAFDAWCSANHKLATTDQFEAWKAGREELRRAQSLDKQPTEPAWIPWEGGEWPVSMNCRRLEVRFRDGKEYLTDGARGFIWTHRGTPGDIVAYRVWEG